MCSLFGWASLKKKILFSSYRFKSLPKVLSSINTTKTMRKSKKKQKQHPTQHTITAWAIRVLYLLIGFPRYTPETFYREIYSPNLPIDEVEYIRQLKSTLEPIQIALSLMTLILIAKNLVFPIYTMLSIDLLDYNKLGPNNWTPESNFSFVASPTVLIEFGCLTTNCTKLSPENNIISDLKRLPVFKLCFPNLRLFYYPILDTHYFGLTMHTVITLCIFIMMILLPLHSYVGPLTHDSVVFVVAPSTIHRLHAEVVRQFLIERLNSFKVYYESWKKSEQEQSCVQLFERKPHSLSQINRKQAIEGLNPSYSEQIQLDRLDEDYSSMRNKKIKDYIDDCIPMIRSDFYVDILKKQYWFLIATLSAYVLMLSVTCMVIPSHMTETQVQEQRKMDQFIDAMGCSIWIAESTGPEVKSIAKVAEPEIKWTWLVFMDVLLELIPSILVVCLALPISIIAIQELNVVVDEQKDRLQLVLELTELFNEMPVENSSTRGLNPICSDRINDSSFKELRLLHREQLRTSFGLVRLQTLENQTAVQAAPSGVRMRDFAAYLLIEHGASLDYYVNLLVKAYISNRALMRLVRSTSANLSRMMLFSYITCYGFTLIVLYFNRKFNHNVHASILYAVAALIPTNIVITSAAHVQAKSRYLLKQMWLLVASTSRYRDPRIRHIRSLWLKQVIVLSQDNGITLKAFNIPVTYETLIETILWSSSLTLLSFNR